jgi:hypothetical protein
LPKKRTNLREEKRGGGLLIKKNIGIRTNRILILFIFLFSSLLLSACVNTDQPKQKISAKNETPKGPAPALGTEWKLPISVPDGEFDKFFGWITESQILYVTNLEQTSSVFVYNLLSGKSELIYSTQNPIVNVQISPSKKNILIHSAPSSYEGLVTIIDTKGKELLIQSFPSYELVFEWNLYNESEVLVSKFEEDWSFQLFLLDIKNDRTNEIFMPQPFVKWMNEGELAYLNWDPNNPSLVAPLKVKEIENESEKTVFPAAIQFSTFRNLLMTVTTNEQDKSVAIYSFFDKQMKKLFTFSIPQLSKFSDWLVPFYDYNEQKGQFITFSPLISGEMDSYTGGFQLLTYDLQQGSSRLIMQGMDNVPLNFSPSGNAVLYGNRLEKIIDLNTKKSYDLIKE